MIDDIPIPEKGYITSFRTFPSAHEIIIEAARKRRLSVADFVGRAALAVAAYDLDIPFLALTKTEHAVYDLRVNRRLVKHGRDFGPWQIGRIDDVR